MHVLLSCIDLSQVVAARPVATRSVGVTVCDDIFGNNAKANEVAS